MAKGHATNALRFSVVMAHPTTLRNREWATDCGQLIGSMGNGQCKLGDGKWGKRKGNGKWAMKSIEKRAVGNVKMEMV